MLRNLRWCELAQELAAVYLRIDSIEQSIRNAGKPVEGEGYRVADITGHRSPTWQEVVERDYRPWE